MRLRALTLVLFLCACKPADPKEPATWIKRLSDSDPRVRQQAVRELRKLKAKTAAPQVADLLKDPVVREEAATTLRDIGSPAEVPALLDAVDTTVGAGSDTATRAAIRTNASIAEALGEIGDASAGPTLLRLARSKDDLVRLEAVQALGAVKFKEAVPELSLLVDDQTAPPLLVKKAIVALGEIGDPAGIPALQHALVIERQGVSFLPEASYALFQLGPAAVQPMIRVARDEDPAYLKWAHDNTRPPAGTYAKAALVLGDLGDARAIPVLLEKLRYRDPDPSAGTARILTNLVRQFAANALGRLRAKDAVAPILALVQTRDPQDYDLVSFCAEALVWIGDRGSAREMMKRAEMGDIRLRILVAQDAALFGDELVLRQFDAIAARARKSPVSQCARELEALQLGDAGDKACDTVAAQFDGLTAPIQASRNCKDSVPCWLDKLKDTEALLRARAAYELGRHGAGEAVPALVQAAADQELVARVAAIRALEWLIGVPAAQPQLKAGADKLAAQLAAEQGRVQFIRVNEELRRLQARLAHL
ncbi:MAG TPA: HEAT repeat domain-containing protein [Myxococcales bacterium]|nr:HEAT repeat domain-containing protein [Myxococcales bacterium]